MLILEWNLANLDSGELCRQIRLRDLIRPYLYILAIVESSGPAEQLEAFQAGVDAIATKPCELDELLARLEGARRIVAHEDNLRIRSEELEQIRLNLQHENETLSEIASSDALTGLRNRRFFWESLDSQFSLARRKGLPLSLIMIDVDQFKAFNDQFGHPAGDDVLQEVGSLLRSCVRDHDVVARYGGEEFAILLPATDEDDSLILADRLRLTIANHLWPLRLVTISLGVATLTSLESQPSDLIEQADRSLYDSKALGRNRVTHARDLTDRDTHALPFRSGKTPMFPSTIPPLSFNASDN